MSATTAREELYELANEQDTNVQEQEKQSLTKDDVVSAIQEYDTYKQKEREDAEMEQRRAKMSQKREAESQELQEVAEAVKSSLQSEMEKDKDFSKTVRESDLPGNLIEYIAEVGEPEEAHLIVRELAGNDEYQDSLKRCKTSVGVKRLIGKIRKDVLTAGTQGKIPPMLKKSIPNYNANNSPSSYDKDYYSDLAMRHGI